MERLVTDMTETEILFDLLEKGISPAHAVSACEKRLTDAGGLWYGMELKGRRKICGKSS